MSAHFPEMHLLKPKLPHRCSFGGPGELVECSNKAFWSTVQNKLSRNCPKGETFGSTRTDRPNRRGTKRETTTFNGKVTRDGFCRNRLQFGFRRIPQIPERRARDRSGRRLTTT
ncbi:hypothetical protein RHA1_ro07006 [Rhodococcus jostii RHA1]|uniref:Uncharacterized protein n=1 Tax=Rhodococcus jostii (strain RHA1) TaxID=101510 RepID=Q0S114_RHOJR|nr:hypothetical protein RHA1_ro07006 [Rhodococcus jostii RHA1]